ncbi:hypothetical protein CVT26_011043 [Gymnopilus dilepis]|uniref:Uncharacterized protein n=1 Tax=Gymnopilus dilepis TaxID=231916 RepID=A0A409WSN1_9AGAR|nr:hypothetical protein CVT26_011043 [Gymnopilus dilepis]
MPNHERFTGLRKAFLEGERERYNEAVTNGTKGDFLMDVIRRFLKRFPLDLEDKKEPTAEFLAGVDDSKPDEELVAPDPTDMPEDQARYSRLLKEYDEKVKLLDTRKKQIARWFVQRKNKDDKGGADQKPIWKLEKEPDVDDPMTILKLRLLGKPPVRPRKSTDYNLWAKDHADKVAKEYAIAANGKKGMNLKLRGRVLQKLFKEESKAVQAAYAVRAEEEHKAIIKKWEDVMQGPPSTTPESQQVCINNLASLMQPILDLLVAHTGMRFTMLGGGPEPAAGGRLNIIGLSSGGTKGSTSNTFPQAEPEKYQKLVLAAFSDFLRKCYTEEDCRASALYAVGESYGPPTSEPIAKNPNAQHDGTHEQNNEHVEESSSSGDGEGIQGGVCQSEGNKDAAQADDNSDRQQSPHTPKTANDDQSSWPSWSYFCRSLPPATPARFPSSSPAPPRSPLAPHDMDEVIGQPDNQAPRPISSPPFVTSPEYSSSLRGPLSSPSPHPFPPLIEKGAAKDTSKGAPRGPSNNAAVPRRKTFVIRPVPKFVIHPSSPLTSASRTLNVPKSMHGQRHLSMEEPARVPASKQADKENGSKKKRKAISDEAAPVPKRRRTKQADALLQAPPPASTTTSYSLFNVEHLSATYLQAQLPAGCDTGIKNTLTMLTSASWDRRWQLMTAEWVRFEKIHDFRQSGKFKSTSRPRAIGDWIKRARASSYKPTVDVNEFQKDFWEWWSNLQPEWRSIWDGDAPQQVRGGWTELDVSGVNGFPSVVAALYFWGLALGKEWRTSPSWALAVDDVYWVLTQLCAGYSE